MMRDAEKFESLKKVCCPFYRGTYVLFMQLYSSIVAENEEIAMIIRVL